MKSFHRVVERYNDRVSELERLFDERDAEDNRPLIRSIIEYGCDEECQMLPEILQNTPECNVHSRENGDDYSLIWLAISNDCPYLLGHLLVYLEGQVARGQVSEADRIQTLADAIELAMVLVKYGADIENLSDLVGYYNTQRKSLTKLGSKKLGAVKIEKRLMEERTLETEPDQQDYIVEKIIGHKKVGRGYQFHVKWKGYPPEDNTWEPRKHVMDCTALGQYLQSQPEDQDLQKYFRGLKNPNRKHL